MAAPHHRTDPHPAGLEDADQPQLVAYEEAVALLARTGHKLSTSTLRRFGLTNVRMGGKDYVDWADVLEEHARRTGAKLRCSSNWP